MKYLLLIYDREADWEAISEADQGKIFQEYGQYTSDIKKSGHHLAGEALQPISTATTVRVKNGKTVTTDGPFAETREQLGGFFLIDAEDLDQALAIAEQIPMAQRGTVEVRPVMEVGGLPERGAAGVGQTPPRYSDPP
jgi:hypothetical protein